MTINGSDFNVIWHEYHPITNTFDLWIHNSSDTGGTWNYTDRGIIIDDDNNNTDPNTRWSKYNYPVPNSVDFIWTDPTGQDDGNGQFGTLGGGGNFVVYSRIANSSRQVEAAIDTNVTNWNKTFLIVYAFEINTGAGTKISAGQNTTWFFKVNGGDRQELNLTSDPASLANAEDLNFVDNQVVTNAERLVNSASCLTFVASLKEHEENSTLSAAAEIRANRCSETQASINLTNASDGDVFQFEIDQQNNGFTDNFTGLAHVILANNTVPNDPEPIINSTDGSNRTLQDLNVIFTPSDNDAGEVLTYNITWYRNNETNLTFGDISVTNGTETNATLEDENTTKAELWSAEVIICDDEISCSNAVNTTQLEILNTPPTQVTLSEPDNDNITNNRTPLFIWNAASDDDIDDILNYTLYVLCYQGCSSDNREESGISPTSFVITPDLLFLWDNLFYYNWSVAAYDGLDYGANSTERNITIASLIGIMLPVANVTFDTKNVGDTDNTTDDDPLPFRINNTGNARVDVYLSSSDPLWISQPLGTKYFQFKVDNYTEENGSFIWDGSQTTFVDIPPAEALILAFNELNYSDATDEAEIDLLIEVPSDEPGGDKESAVVLTASLSE